jgi:uncharacterized lipoprotein YmbA
MRPFKPLLSAVLLLALTACVGAPTRFYTLRPSGDPGVARSAYAGPPFRIDAVHIPATLDRPELVRDLSGDRFTVSDNAHWAGPLGELFRRVLTQDLAARLPVDAVVFPDAPKPAGAGGLVVDILDVTPQGGAVVMDVSWTLLPAQGHTARTGAPDPMRQRTVRLSTPAVGGSVSGDAMELSALAAQLATNIAADLASPSR